MGQAARGPLRGHGHQETRGRLTFLGPSQKRGGTYWIAWGPQHIKQRPLMDKANLSTDNLKLELRDPSHVPEWAGRLRRWRRMPERGASAAPPPAPRRRCQGFRQRYVLDGGFRLAGGRTTSRMRAAQAGDARGVRRRRWHPVVARRCRRPRRPDRDSRGAGPSEWRSSGDSRGLGGSRRPRARCSRCAPDNPGAPWPCGVCRPAGRRTRAAWDGARAPGGWVRQRRPTAAAGS